MSRMKSALWLTLTCCLVASALPVAAQEPVTAGPIARSIASEAARFAAAQPNQSADAEWSRVRNLAPGTEVVLTVKGSQPGGRSFVIADEAQLTTLHRFVDQDGRAATRVLLDRAAHHPESFADIQQAGAFVDNDVRVGPDGVFVAGRKVADLGQFVERIARTDVLEIRVIRTRGSTRGAVIGTGAGLLLGVTTMLGIGFNKCTTAQGGCHGAWGPLMGLAVVGFPVAGGVLGYRASSHKTEDVIYRAP